MIEYCNDTGEEGEGGGEKERGEEGKKRSQEREGERGREPN